VWAFEPCVSLAHKAINSVAARRQGNNSCASNEDGALRL